MKMERLIGILSILLQRENVTAPELAEQFEVSRRTIQRDIESLCRAGIPISTAQGAGGGISIMEGYRVDRTVLTDPEMQAILAGLRSLDSISGTRRYAQLMEKLSAGTGGLVPGSAHMLIDLSSWYKTSLPPKIELIQGAIEQHHTIRFTYFSPKEESVRIVEPCYL
ncbi:helix-turn-helix transcriptional regulator, partial [Intestinimonas butyriciproducens]